MTVVLIILGATALILSWLYRAKRRDGERGAYIESFDFPPGIGARVRKRYPHLTDQDLALVFGGLRQYFQLSRLAQRRALAMPSQVVDAAWHEFILFTRNYDRFCSRALGRFLHHTPAEAMRSQTEAQEGIRRAWRLACALEGIDPRTPARLPLLFALDDKLRIPDGFRYALNCMAAATAMRAQGEGAATYCASHIGCGSGGGDGGCSSDSGCSSGGCSSGGCGGGGD